MGAVLAVSFSHISCPNSQVLFLDIVDFYINPLFLSNAVPCLVIERYATSLRAPKAHALSPRTLEIARQFGLDTAALRRLGTKREDAFWVNFVTTLAGEHVGRLPYERMDVEVLEDTPEVCAMLIMRLELSDDR